jgi:hypothetical protein
MCEKREREEDGGRHFKETREKVSHSLHNWVMVIAEYNSNGGWRNIINEDFELNIIFLCG